LKITSCFSQRFGWQGWAILALALGLRLWGLDFGLPNLSRPDEQNISSLAMRMLQDAVNGQPDWNPHWFEYPSLYIYCVSALYALTLGWGQAIGAFPDPESFFQLYASDYGSFHLISRLLTAGLGTLTVWLTIALGHCLHRSRWMGWLAGLLLAVTLLHVRDSHFGTTDVPATFFTVLCAYGAVHYVRHGRLSWLILAALACGLAAATKYPAGLSGVMVVLAYGLRARTGLSSIPWHRIGKAGLGLAATAGLGFFIASPFVILDVNTFWRDFSLQRDHLQHGHFLDLGPGWWYHLRFTLWYGLGGAYCLLALLGIGLTSRRLCLYRAWWVLISFVGVYYLVMGGTHTVFVRYMMPVVPFLSLFAAMALLRFPWHLPLKPFARRWGRIGLIVWVVMSSLIHCIQLDRLLSQPDTRTLARDWLLAHAPAGQCVGVGPALGQVELPNRYRKLLLKPFEEPPQPGQLTGRHFVPIPTVQFKVLNNARNEAVISTYTRPDALRQLGCQYVLLTRSPLSLYSTPVFELEALAAQYRLHAHFSPYSDPTQPPTESQYDAIDAFYLPYADFQHVLRPGPEVWIYAVPATNPLEDR
jgi:4-amino-4-deoxy-L-arabinose transferase-like glycosyltransferase